MGWSATFERTDRRLVAFTLVAIACGLWWLVPFVVALPFLVLAGGAIAALSLLRRRDQRLRDVALRLEALAGKPGVGSLADRLASGVEFIADRLSDVQHRLDHRHALTGLPTREPLIARMMEDGAGTLGVIGIMDFDRLCAFDPLAGESMLLAIVDRMAQMLPGDRLLAHIDRSSFAIWFAADVGREAAQAELDVLGYALGDVIVAGDREIVPEIRVRQSTMPDDGESAQAVVARTLAALALKSGPTVSAVAASVDPIELARERYAMEQDLRRAIERGEFSMHYQPLIDAGKKRVAGAEALIRWFHPTLGQVSPSRFIPIVEAMGLADEVGLWALNAAAREARGWTTQGLGSLRVAVNVSGHQLEHHGMAALVSRTLARHGLAADALEFELTESVAMSDGARAAGLLAALRAMGVRIAIDDFGTGYSSFSALRTIAFDKIKIDREFVTNVDTRRDSQAICQSIVALGRGLGIRVLAEGVERRDEFEWLLRHGCTHFQGYYFAPPLTGEAFVAFVRDTNALEALLSTPRALRHRITERFIA